MAVRIGLMGFGRIGRNVFRMLHDRTDLEVAVIVDTADPASLAYLLEFDTIYGRFPEDVQVGDGGIQLESRFVPVVAARAPGEMTWSDFDVEIVVQATGKYRTAAECARHLDSGASRVILASTPETPGDIPILLTGVNDDLLVPDLRVVALGSNTSNAIAPVLATLDEAFGIRQAFFTTVHAFTNQARLADVPGSEMRTSRAAGENIIPTETNSPQILETVLPSLAGKLAGLALNVPVPDGSAVDLLAVTGRPTSIEEVNSVIKEAAEKKYPHILDFETDPIVSSDVVGLEYSGVFDSLATMVMDETMVKVLVWFDNGWGYSARIVDTIIRMAGFGSTT